MVNYHCHYSNGLSCGLPMAAVCACPLSRRDRIVSHSENASATYVFIYQYKNWTEAQSYCREHHTDLISIRNETENQKIQYLLRNYYYYYYHNVWIGLYKTRSWSDQSNTSFTYWSTWQPDTAGSCTVVSFRDSGKWMDENCNYAFPFFCHSGE
uniref:C-type lectin domain-containing protein n=1 Tax=Sinocyclocheilus rhinocerous TaxID=307959 RepID=A0A673IG88_9TELE